MTIFFTIVALVHVCGLYAMLLALRRAPVAVESSRGFQVIAQPEEMREVVGAQARTA
jgi:hypothetical protein